ncbi:MAG: GNAT family N-acetyltransferase [Burkholderiaceae bacterium]|nr:GNAT family N-acetyltransferase [Burkholderiaceae bacterium]
MDTAVLTMRAANPADLPALESFVRGLSTLARAQRFFAPVSSLPSMLADALRRDDPLHRFVVVDTPAGDIVAFAEYAVDPDARDTCSVAIAVGDAWQRRGLGLALLRQVIVDAERRGLATAVGEVLRYNRAMLALARRLGFEVRAYPGDATLVRIIRPLRAPPAPEAANAATPAARSAASTARSACA